MKFVDIKNDVAFRKIFGNEKKSESEVRQVIENHKDK